MNIILLSGGSGKRLWPLSNDIRSKQFIKIFKKENGEYESMVQRIYGQIKAVDPDAVVTIATSKSQVSAIHNQLGFDVTALWITMGTLVAAATIALLIMQLIKIFRELRHPKLVDEKIIQEKLAKAHERLTKLEQSTDRQETELKLLLRSQLVMVHHSIDGNSIENLKNMLKQIEEYLVFGEVKK